MKKKSKRLIRKSKKSERTFSYNSKFIVVFFSVFVLFFTVFYFNLQKENTSLCANSISCANNLSGNYDSSVTEGVFMGKNVRVPYEITNKYLAMPVLGENTNQEKHIYVDLTNQRLYAFEGDKLVYNFLVSTGKWGKTPTGDFNIWVKLRYTKMEGGSKDIGTYYYLPNVPYVMFFYNNDVSKSRGYSIHGTYWHSNFGHPMSHGCVNMKIEEVEKLYYWANPPTQGSLTYASYDVPGTLVTIYGEAPAE